MLPIAIVGLGGVFPGAVTLEEFFKRLKEGRDMSSDASEKRWGMNPASVYQPWPPAPDRVYSIRGYFIDHFTPNLSGLALDLDLTSRLDPGCLMAIHAARQALETCGHTEADLARSGVILGQLALPTDAATALCLEVIGGHPNLKSSFSLGGHTNRFAPSAYRVTGLPAAITATGLGLGLGGYTLDAACASSLYAIKLACDELISGRADIMLAGGVTRPDCLYTQMGFSQLRALSVSGRCAPFDAKGDGLLVGEGAGVVALKRLDDALTKGDRIWGVIRGWGLSNDLEGSLLAPAREGQLRAMNAAYQTAGWSPWEVDLIEGHATGTPVGDRVEFESLKALWRDAPTGRDKCVLGSVKSTVGHLLTGAGAAGLIKILLALNHKMLFPTANFQGPHPDLGMDASPFTVLSEARSWESSKGVRKAAVSGFGFGGINAHVLVEEWTRDESDNGYSYLSARENQLEEVAVVGLAASVGPWRDIPALMKRWFSEADSTVQTGRAGWWGMEGEFPEGYYIDEVPVPIGQFRIPPTEIADMLPQQAAMLVTAAEALSDAGYRPDPDRINAGTFIGLSLDPNTTNYHLRWTLEKQTLEMIRKIAGSADGSDKAALIGEVKDAVGPPLSADRVLGALGSITASRIAREFKMTGGSYTVSSDETSGLTALKTAFRAVAARELDLAVAGAVDFMGDVRTLTARPKENRDDAGLPSDGSAAVVLKRLSEAKRDGNTIYAVLRGFDRMSNRSGQSGDVAEASISRALGEAGITLEQLDFIETHGSGLIEDRAAFIGRVADESGQVGAAGALVSFVRASLALKNRTLPACYYHTGEHGQQSGLQKSPPVHWIKNRQDGPRITAVSAMNVDGGATSAIITEYQDNELTKTREVRDVSVPDEWIFPVRGSDRSEVMAGMQRLKGLLSEHQDRNVESLFASWIESPQHGENNLTMAMIARDAGELSGLIDESLSRLESGAERVEEARIFFESEPLGREGDLAFVFPGSGNHFPGMGRDLAKAWPEIFRQQDRCNERLKDQFGVDYFWYDGHREPDQRVLIESQVAVGTAVYDILTAGGIKPKAVIGHSLGETASLFATRTWTGRDDMLSRMEASSLFSDDLAGECRAARTQWGLTPATRVDWLSGLAACPPEKVTALLPDFPRVYLQIINAPAECMIGGEADSVRRMVERLGCVFVPVKGVAAVHCDVVHPVKEAYRKLHLFDTTPPADIRIYSAAWGRPYLPDRDSAADSITDQALSTMNFPELIQRAYDDGVRLFLELGPGNSCTRMISRILTGQPYAARPVYAPGRDVRLSARQAQAWALVHGVKTDESKLCERRFMNEIPEIDQRARAIVIPTGRTDVELPDLKNLLDEIDRPEESHPQTGGPAGMKQTSAAPSSVQTDVESRATVEAAHLVESQIRGLVETREALAEAHADYLKFSEGIQQAMAENLAFQIKLTESLMTDGSDEFFHQETPIESEAEYKPAPFMDCEACLEYAVGSIGKVLGGAYAPIDAFPTRVRLPDEPLMLVDRILTVEGEPLSLKSGRVVTQHDVLEEGWYLDNQRMATCVAIESGQADLFLSGYLGIDFKTRGLAVYRLLDAEVTFQGDLPKPGAVITYDIRIDRFFQHGDTYLFRFNFDAVVDGRPLMIMRNGCAGFFTPAELASGKGLTIMDLNPKVEPATLPDDWADLALPTSTSLTDDQVKALYNGDLAGCFGEAFGELDIRDALTLPSGRLNVIDRVTCLELRGGRYGLGIIRTEMDIHPDDWFLTCHFVDDMVMPGTLMYECCLHSLRIYLLSLGWIGEKDVVVAEPVPGISSKLKCRGQVIASTKKAAYEIHIKELGYTPAPYAIADGIMYADDRPVVLVEDMTVQLTGLSRKKLVDLWKRPRPDHEPTDDGVVFDYQQVLAFAEGKPSDAFGAPYRPFDQDRFIARLPRPPYSFIDRIVRVQGAVPFEIHPGAEAVAEYEPPTDAWYFKDNNGSMPYAVLLEIALQPCGWLSAYSGAALTSKVDLHFRNLGGTAVQKAIVYPGNGVLTTTVQLSKSSRSGDMIIQHYEFRVTSGERIIYEGTTYFGFFTKESLANQVGLQGDAGLLISEGDLSGSQPKAFPDKANYPQGMIRMVDEITYLSLAGGPKGLGAVTGRKTVDSADWFFQAHFYQDPVWPGSLGLEAFVQLLQVLAGERWELDESIRFEACAPGIGHEWIYRGQVIPSNKVVNVEATVIHVDDEKKIITADGLLSVDGKPIYRIKDFSVRCVQGSKFKI